VVDFLRGDSLPPLQGTLNLVQRLCAAVCAATASMIARRWSQRRLQVAPQLR
jgi:hypothetical protein